MSEQETGITTKDGIVCIDARSPSRIGSAVFALVSRTPDLCAAADNCHLRGGGAVRSSKQLVVRVVQGDWRRWRCPVAELTI